MYMYDYFRNNEATYLYEILSDENIQNDYEYNNKLRKNRREENEINE